MSKKLYFLLLVLAPFAANAQSYDAQNINLIGHWYNPNQDPEPVYDIQYQGIWGWYDSIAQREYAIMGASDGTYFIDVTNPAVPVMCDFVPAAHGDLIWHEIKTYQNYCYIVSDDGAPNTFIIADMSYLPDSVHIVRNDNVIFERCHTIFIEGSKLWCGSVTGDNNAFFYSMAVYDLAADPTTPTLIRTLNQDYSTPNHVHDMFVRGDTCYASGGYDGLFIYTFTSTFQQIGILTSYPESGYNHSSFLTADGSTLIFMDEVPAGRGIKSIDVSNMGNITVNQTFRSNTGNTPHNPYILGNNILIGANYTDGLQIFNISNPSAIYRTGYFDTDTLINFPNYSQAYHGCWGAYTDLPSGLLICSDMQNGLFVLDISSAITGTPNVSSPLATVSAYPNPFNSNFFVNLNTTRSQNVTWSVYDATGRVVLSATESVPAGPVILEIPAAELASGVYSVMIEGEEMVSTAKLVKE
jgi:choice-of-anchor B domain-containing protein